MRKMLLTVVVLVIAVSAWATDRGLEIRPVTEPTALPATGIEQTRASRIGLDEIIFFETWDTGDFNGWVAVDNTAQPSTWHTDAFNAFGGTGESWWVGDPDVGPNGGYLDDWYMTLDSPPVQLGATPSLSFFHRFKCEDPAGATAPYNGWDGMNIRISTDGGATWTVIANPTPAYTRSSLYSFGFQHGEGPNVPGWCGALNNWTQVTANLTQWANQSVKIRWAFASDPAFSTPDDATLFGWMVDNIRVYNGAGDTVLTNDGVPATFTTGTNVPVGGNLWRVENDASAPTEPHVVVCNDTEDNRYNPNMNSEFISPNISIEGLANGILMADVFVTGEVICPDGAFPDCDYWGMQVSTDGGQSWCYASNPSCDPNGDNYVYTDMPTSWASFNASYSTPMDLSAYLGVYDSVKFKFTMESNDDDESGAGPKFDDFSLDYQAGFPNDLTCYAFQVRFPNAVNRPIKVKAYYENVGQVEQAQVPAWYRIVGQTQQRFLPNLQLAAGEGTTREATVTVAAAGTINMLAWHAMTSDQFQANDTSYSNNIVVRGASEALEFGYDNREINFRYNYETGSGACTHFTPVADDELIQYNLNTVRAKFDAGQVGDLPIRLIIYADNAGAPGAVIWDEEVTVLQSETGPNTWKDINVESPGTRDLTGDFWTFFQVLATGADRYPQVLGDAALEWDDVHYYTYTGTGNPTQVNAFHQIHALVVSTSAADDVIELIPGEFSLEQNFPNPFNPSTEIRYNVPRATDLTLSVYNVLGQEVATLVSGRVEAGVHNVTFDASSLASGVYVYSLKGEGVNLTRKMLLMK